MSREMSEDRLVQETMANYLLNDLQWDESIFAYNTEVLGENGTLGRKTEKEIYLVRYIRQALEKLNPNLPEAAYESAIKQITEISVARSTLQVNHEKYGLFKNGVRVSFKNDKGEIDTQRLKVFDFKNPDENHFLALRELWISQTPYRRRPDIIGFVNGIPLIFVELKNIHKDIRRAYDENLKDYKDSISHIFDANAFIILSNGDGAKVGTITSEYGHFHEWKRLAEEDEGVVDFETMLKGMCSKKGFMDIFENFLTFDESYGKAVKILARNHQYLGVNRAVMAVEERRQRNGKLGVFWHTQGSGKSYSMVFFSQKVHRRLEGNFTFLIVTDREDLDKQIYTTFSGCGIVDNDRDKCRASSGVSLKNLLTQDKQYVFTIIHKFNQDVDPNDPYSKRDDIIVISDEAHRTQYGRLALNMRNALPNAHYIGFTGTPLFKNDELTKRIFGNYVSTYDFQRAVEDNATVPLYYENRGEKLKITKTKINERIAEKLEEIELDEDRRARLEEELGRDYHIFTAKKRLNAIARDFVEHYSVSWEMGKAMFICIDKITAVRMYNLIQDYWQKRIVKLEKKKLRTEDEQENKYIENQIHWMKETIMAVVISEEQNEVDKFRKWELEIVPHRALIKKGFETPDGKRIDVETAFKKPEHQFRIVFVCAMWLTGFDVECLANLYLDKPLKAHTLMQAIARANRVYEGKNNGLVMDYCGILKNLREALATFAVGSSDTVGGENIEGINPVKPEEELIEDLSEVIEMTKSYLKDRGFLLEKIIKAKGFGKNAAIVEAKEVVNQSEETRKRFEILAREVFKKFKACLTIKEVNDYRIEHDTINVIYKKLQGDKVEADISDIIKLMHSVVDDSIAPIVSEAPADSDRLFDISNIDFEKLKREFQKSHRKNTTVQCLKNQVESRLDLMMKRNPLRLDYYKRYQEIIAEYNKEKDRITIEETFAELMKFIDDLDEEDRRAIREGLNEENLALFDLLCKPDLKPKDRNRIKDVARQLLDHLKDEKLRMDNWREKESTKAEVKTYIHDFLWDDKTGLPVDIYSPEEVNEKTELVFEHIFRQYEDAEHNIYAVA